MTVIRHQPLSPLYYWPCGKAPIPYTSWTKPTTDYSGITFNVRQNYGISKTGLFCNSDTLL